MYEHLRNELLLDLEHSFNSQELDQIMTALDRVAANYTIAERETSLAVIDDEVPKLVRLYLSSKKLEGVSDKTIDLYGGMLRIFFRYVRRIPQDICTNEIRLFLAEYQMQRGISDRSLDKFRQVLNCFFDWCLNEEYISKNPCKNIKEIKFDAEPRRSLTRRQLEQVRRACVTKRDIAIVDVLYSTGCRVTELVNMRFWDIDTEQSSVRIMGKGKKHNTVYLNETAKLSLEDYLAERKIDSEYLFISDRAPYGKLSVRSVQHLFADIGKKLNIKLSPHIIRHTSATLALQSGMSITQVQKMLGHSSVNTTQIYAETTQEDVAAAHKKYVI